jgi:cytochrome P450
MFEINDDFLTGIGYDVALLSDEKKQSIVEELSKEFMERMQERFLAEIDETQAEDFDRMQENIENTRGWLAEFHADYRDLDDFKQLVQVMDDEDEAVQFYASELWIRDAVPNYRDAMQEELQTYYDDLVKKRAEADELLSQLG